MKKKILITGGAGFIGSSLVDYFIRKGHHIVCLDNLSTGFYHNIEHNIDNSDFTFINDDIRNLKACKNAVKECDYVLHHAALGSVPRSVDNPALTNEVNIDGFLNILIAARDEKVKRFIYAASSSTYGDSKTLPKVEEIIGRPLSPYAITKYVNELYADVFAKTYGMQCIGLRYFNVFGERQSPKGAYAAVIPLWVKNLIEHKAPIINGDGSHSRDFTYIGNVLYANEKALSTPVEDIISAQREYYLAKNDIDNTNIISNYLLKESNQNFSEILNVAYGGKIALIDLFKLLRENLAIYDKEIGEIEPVFGANRIGDIAHSQADIKKGKKIIGYKPQYTIHMGIKQIAKWYFNKHTF